jgi:hypothetical protein
MITARVAAEDRLPNRGCAGGVTLLVTGSHSCYFFLHHEEFEFLFLVDVLYGVPRVWCSEVERPEILVVEKSQSLLILKVFNYYVRRFQLLGPVRYRRCGRPLIPTPSIVSTITLIYNIVTLVRQVNLSRYQFPHVLAPHLAFVFPSKFQLQHSIKRNQISKLRIQAYVYRHPETNPNLSHTASPPVEHTFPPHSHTSILQTPDANNLPPLLPDYPTPQQNHARRFHRLFERNIQVRRKTYTRRDSKTIPPWSMMEITDSGRIESIAPGEKGKRFAAATSTRSTQKELATHRKASKHRVMGGETPKFQQSMF